MNNCPYCNDFPGQHYHCANCGMLTSMYGHYVFEKNDYSCKENREWLDKLTFLELEYEED